MKVLHVIDLMSVGGAQILIKGIFERYNNPEHYLFVLRKSENLIEVNHRNVTYANAAGKYSIKPLIELKKFIQKNDIQIIHCYLLKSQVFTWILKRTVLPKLKIIFHELGEIFMNNSRIFKYFMKTAEKRTNLYFAVSDSTAQALHEKIGITEKKIVTLYNYVIHENYRREDILKNRARLREAQNIAPSDFIIGYAGRLSYEKGPIHLINALPFLSGNYKLFIAGTGPQREMLENQIEEIGLSDKVVFLGFVTRMIDAYALFDALIIPSEHESFGLVAVEAQCMKIPVIASNVPGLNEVVIENISGLQFESKKPEDLARQISKLMSDKALQTDLAEKAYRYAMRYDIEKYYSKMMQAYAEL